MAALQSERVWELERVQENWARPTRPQLLLCDVTEDLGLVRRRTARQWNRVLFLVTAFAAAVCLIAMTARTVQQTMAVRTFPPVSQTLTVHVAKGDTLWQYAARYGDPDQYILARVDTLARANHLSADAVLRPGQTLRIPVQNPAALASLASRHAPRA